MRVKSSSTAMLVTLLASVMSMGCATRIGPGYVGIKVDLAGSQRGVEDLPTRTGWVFYSPFSSQVIEYPTFVQTAKWTRSAHEGDNPSSEDGVNEEISFNDSNGLNVSADISLSYHIAAEKIPAFYVKFRSDDINQFTHGYLRNVARDAFNDVGGTYSAEDIIGAKKEEFVKAVRAKTQSNTSEIGVVIDQLGFIESPRPPAQVTNAINAKVSASQIALQKQNEVMQAKADADKLAAQAEGEARARVARAEAEARANRLVSDSITQPLVQWKYLETWDGKLPQVQSGTSSGLMLQLPGR